MAAVRNIFGAAGLQEERKRLQSLYYWRFDTEEKKWENVYLFSVFTSLRLNDAKWKGIKKNIFLSLENLQDFLPPWSSFFSPSSNSAVIFSKESKDFFSFSYHPARDKELKRRQGGSRRHVWIREKKERIHERLPSEGQKCRGRAATPCDNDDIFQRLHKVTQWVFFFLLYSHSDCFSEVSLEKIKLQAARLKHSCGQTLCVMQQWTPTFLVGKNQDFTFQFSIFELMSADGCWKSGICSFFFFFFPKKQSACFSREEQRGCVLVFFWIGKSAAQKCSVVKFV